MAASLSGLADFLIFFSLAVALVALYLALYTLATAHNEFALIRENVISAAVALVLSLVGFAVGMLQTLIIRSAWWIPVSIALLVGTATAALWALAGAVVGRPELVTPRLVVIAPVVGIFAALLCPLGMRALRWAWGPQERALS